MVTFNNVFQVQGERQGFIKYVSGECLGIYHQYTRMPLPRHDPKVLNYEILYRSFRLLYHLIANSDRM